MKNFLELGHTDYYDTRGHLSITPIKFGVKQINYSQSLTGALRGLHYQIKEPLSKIITVLYGDILFMSINIDTGETQQEYFSRRSSIYVSSNISSGFLALSYVELQYLYSEEYNPLGEGVISPFGLGFALPKGGFIQSDRDKKALTFEEWRKGI